MLIKGNKSVRYKIVHHKVNFDMLYQQYLFNENYPDSYSGHTVYFRSLKCQEFFKLKVKKCFRGTLSNKKKISVYETKIVSK